MKCLIVHAHENPNSFCSALASTASEVLIKTGYEVELSDLYKMSFNPVASKNDFKDLSGDPYYKYANEQLYSSKHNSFANDIQFEIEKLISADIINFNFPMWWWGMPAILKGWVDRIMAYGVAYGGDYGFDETGRFKGRHAFISTTTGSPKPDYNPHGQNEKSIEEILSNIHEGTFELLGYTVLDPFIAYGVSKISQKERENIIIEYKDYLKKALNPSKILKI